MRPELGRGLILVALGLVVTIGVTACGGSSAPSTPAQQEARQRIDTYVEAVNKAGASFHGAATVPLLKTAIAELARTVPPAQFKASYQQLIGSLRGELAAAIEHEHAEQTHNAALLKKAEAAQLTEIAIARGALAEATKVLTKCQHDNFAC